MLTVSCPDSRLDFQGFADKDGGVRVGLFHGRVLLGKERAVVELLECWLRMAMEGRKGIAMYRTAALCSEVWQWWKRSSLSAFENDCLSDMFVYVGWVGYAN